MAQEWTCVHSRVKTFVQRTIGDEPDYRDYLLGDEPRIASDAAYPALAREWEDRQLAFPKTREAPELDVTPSRGRPLKR